MNTDVENCWLFIRGLDALGKKAKAPAADLPIESVSLSLRDLTGYLHPPDEQLEHEDRQNRLRALKNRQNLFQEEVRGSCASVCAVAPRSQGGVGRGAWSAGPAERGRGLGEAAECGAGMSFRCPLGLRSRPSPRCGRLPLTCLKTDSNVCVARVWRRQGVQLPGGAPRSCPGVAGSPGEPGRQAPAWAQKPPLPLACVTFPRVVSFTRRAKSCVLQNNGRAVCYVSRSPRQSRNWPRVFQRVSGRGHGRAGGSGPPSSVTFSLGPLRVE